MKQITVKSPRLIAAPSGTSLLALFILSPTAGTLVAAWRGVKLLIARYHERRALEGRALGLRHRPYAQIRHACPSCGFGNLRMWGGPPRPTAKPRRNAADQHYLRCDRPGCHHIAPRWPAHA